ncbi:FAD/NAD(P)-binding domain-containing protein [Pleurostoma richardsiae]|uniref:FAD/NAD(P)-binding domain-containing protein n=1 Tax=Pleurostoma richardsiae TaxID=41990 RepID=A0AA38RGJ0_9PEZI|nr:FAD/NAD(P)-binding domain-containing protein [Pleurostoma richardsiae]
MDREIHNGQKVAVIGLGALGLVTLKNLSEEGFDVTGFDGNDYVGGLWRFSEENKTSVLPTTVTNISKERGCYTDFPFPDETPSLCPASEVEKYLESYTEHFKLGPRLRLGTLVTRVTRDEDRQKWVIHIAGRGSEDFDKVVLATGSNRQPHFPAIKGLESFSGVKIHSQAYKKPEVFKGKNVLVVGFGNTGADTAVSLAGVANKIYLSHRDGVLILPRTRRGRPVDHSLTARLLAAQAAMTGLFPKLAEWLFNKFAQKLQDSAFIIRPEWRISPAPSLKHSVPVVSDEIVPALEAGTVTSVPGISQVMGPQEVKFDDGSVAEIDVVILCTGYRADFTLLEERYDPTRNTTAQWTAAKGSRGKPLPRLYRNIFSLDHPDSLAFMGCVAFATPAFQLYDLASMALAQVWKGSSLLPPQAEMERAVDRHHAWLCDIAREGNVFPGLVDWTDWMPWADRTAGTAVDENLGWGWKGWKFWLTNFRFCNLLMTGVYSPHVYRVFDGKRKKWAGAREEIEKVNRLASRKREHLISSEGSA